MGKRNKTKIADLFGDDEPVEDVELKVNEEYARRFQHNKEREELHRLKEKHPEAYARLELGAAAGGDSETEESDDEDEDMGEIPEVTEREIFETLRKIRDRDPSIYDKSAKFYTDLPTPEDSGDAGEPRGKAARPKYLKDVIAEQALANGAVDSSDEEGAGKERGGGGKAYDEEQRRIKREFLAAAQGRAGSSSSSSTSSSSSSTLSDSDSDTESGGSDFGGLLRRKQRHSPEGADGAVAPEVAAALDGYFGRGSLSEGDAFLRDYIAGQRWREAGDGDGEGDGEGAGAGMEVGDDEDAAFLEKQEEHEYRYNFRFEEPGADRLVTHPRAVDTVRRDATSRAAKRQAREERKRAEADARADEVKRLKNLKKREIESRLSEVYGVAGSSAPLDALRQAIEGDFDPDRYDAVMAEAFGEGYYGAEDDGEGMWDDEALMKEIAGFGSGDEEAGFEAARRAALARRGGGGERENGDGDGEGEDGDGEGGAGSDAARVRDEMHRMLEEYYKLDYEDVVGGDIKTRFRYREVEPQSYGLSAREILRLEDRELNQIVGLKKLAPYREDGGRVGGKALRYKLQQFGVGGEGRGEVGGRGTGGEGRGRGRGRAGGGAGRGTHGASDGGQGQGQGQGSSRRETYERPLLVKRGEKVEDAKARQDRKRKRQEGEARNAAAQDPSRPRLTKAQKKNMRRCAKRAAKAAETGAGQ